MDDLIVLRSFIAASNLQCRGSPIVKAVPCVYASELSFFTTNPRQQYLQTAQQELRRSVPAVSVTLSSMPLFSLIAAEYNDKLIILSCRI